MARKTVARRKLKTLDVVKVEAEFETRASVRCLTDALETHRDRAYVYGRNDRMHGDVMQALFPDGVDLKRAGDHARFGLFTQLVSKLTRYAINFDGNGHPDSLRDITVYAAMLEGMDEELKQRAVAS